MTEAGIVNEADWIGSDTSKGAGIASIQTRLPPPDKHGIRKGFPET